MAAFPSYFFAFPLNLIFLVLWVAGCALARVHCSKSPAVRFLHSPAATLISISVFLLLCLLIGFTGCRELAGSWIFVVSAFFLQTVLLFVIMRGWRCRSSSGGRKGKIRWRFLMLHLGLLAVIGSMFWGAPDRQTLRIKAVEGTECRDAYNMDGRLYVLKYDVLLSGFDVREYENGTPSAYSAVAEIDGKKVSIRVNEPYSRTLCEDIYLVGFDPSLGTESSYCIFEIVREPWKYLTVAGIVLLLAGAVLLFVRGPSESIRQ